MTAGKKLYVLESYCNERGCTGCEMLDKDHDCKLGYVEDTVELLLEYFGLNDLCKEIEKAGRSANQSAK